MNIFGISPDAPATAHQDAAPKRLEQAFLAEMLRLAMPDPAESPFSGGVGETQFHSFLTSAQADLIAGRLAGRLDFMPERRHG